MQSHIAPRSERLLKSFEYWTVVPSCERPGSCEIVLRRDLERGSLLPKEREELFGTIIPTLEVMYAGMLGPCTTRGLWQNGVFLLEPLTLGLAEFPFEKNYELFSSLVAASA